MAAIQTVFEGSEINTSIACGKVNDDMDYVFPSGMLSLILHHAVSAIMEAYHSAGTPSFIVIAPDGRVVYDGFLVAANDGLI